MNYKLLVPHSFSIVGEIILIWSKEPGNQKNLNERAALDFYEEWLVLAVEKSWQHAVPKVESALSPPNDS